MPNSLIACECGNREIQKRQRAWGCRLLLEWSNSATATQSANVVSQIALRSPRAVGFAVKARREELRLTRRNSPRRRGCVAPACATSGAEATSSPLSTSKDSPRPCRSVWRSSSGGWKPIADEKTDADSTRLRSRQRAFASECCQRHRALFRLVNY
jgi:hypothetical protein